MYLPYVNQVLLSWVLSLASLALFLNSAFFIILRFELGWGLRSCFFEGVGIVSSSSSVYLFLLDFLDLSFLFSTTQAKQQIATTSIKIMKMKMMKIHMYW